MLERDYFLKIIEEFAVAIQRFLNKKKEQQTDEEIQDLYRQYVGDYDILRNLTVEEAIDYARQEWEDYRQLEKLKMLADLWYTEGAIKQQPLRDILLTKSFKLFDYIDGRDKTFSLLRQQKMTKIREMLHS
ncbi:MULTISPECIES: hypothetical protein [Segatella]|jgi:hypothetical protein|uniref:Uncharacterized protein n=2 Tax=Segatella TaxID=2974251 RepID=D8DXD5_9BACT|nr:MULTISPECIES: hypothetical protein [Segatella]MBQ3858509.1 hypothetical protein [Prevotella sp.]EFI71899.1 conserved hypothetical protein [Segatella baroniae B14]MDR4930296.1 hypothetical protein [Segatella bryantii]MEE3414618.1 hypothetical protein [Prevotella sp.]OYP55801.1 hypothetical protein CIK91_05550 [Segatella bryantii]